VVVVATLQLSCLERKISEKMKIKKLRRGKGRLELPEVIGMGCLG
jgi:fumarylacetoacetate (FAA) hydrolase family protein